MTGLGENRPTEVLGPTRSRVGLRRKLLWVQGSGMGGQGGDSGRRLGVRGPITAHFNDTLVSPEAQEPADQGSAQGRE